jgi:hypothetical protein
MRTISKFLALFLIMINLVACAQQKEYPQIVENHLILEGNVNEWDEGAVHTFSAVKADKDGYKYWGYYGLDHYESDPKFRKGGLVRSNDLVNWEKYEGNPIILENCRWPTVVYHDSTFYMFYAEYRKQNGDSQIVMVSSKDGINFNDRIVVVPYVNGEQNQNPFIYFDKNDSNFYLFYYNGTEQAVKNKKWNIAVKNSTDILSLKKQKPIEVLSSNKTLAAPSIAFYNNTYYLLVEEFDKAKDKWVTNAFQSNNVLSGYTRVLNNPILDNNDACAFQYSFNDQLYVFYSYGLNLKEGLWNLRMIKLK